MLAARGALLLFDGIGGRPFPRSRVRGGSTVVARLGVMLRSSVSSQHGRPPVLHAIFQRGEVAQLVEHTTENRSVDSSILSLATIT
jgi:hypothetical protein